MKGHSPGNFVQASQDSSFERAKENAGRAILPTSLAELF